MKIRKATKEDAQAIYDLILELAVFEKGEHKVKNTPEQIAKDGFSSPPLFECILAEVNDEIVGMSLYYYRYSTWKGKILYLEDLIVKEKYRGQGIGKKLLDETISIAKNTNSKGIKWQVLDWNTPAIKFYETYDVEFDGEWLDVKLFF